MNKPYKHKDLKDKFHDFEYPVDDAQWEKMMDILPLPNNASLSTKFDHLSITPSPKVWKNIAEKLHPKRKRKIIFYFSMAASLLLLLGVYFSSGKLTPSLAIKNKSTFPLHKDNKLGRDTGSTKNKKDNTSGTKIVSPNKALTTKTTSLAPDGKPKQKNSLVESTANSNFASVKKTSTVGINGLKIHMNNFTQKNALKNDINDSFDTSKNESDLFVYLTPKPTPVIANIPVEKNILGNYYPWVELPPSIIANESNNSLAFSSGFSPTTNTESINSFALDEYEINSWSDTILDTPFNIVNDFQSNEQTTFEDEVFSVPLSFNVLFQRKISSRWSLSGGIGYLLLRSTSDYKVISPFNIYQVESNFKREYLSLPVAIQYRIINRKKFALYSSLGSTFELSVQGQKSTTATLNGVELPRETAKLNLGIGQMNANVGLGSQVRIYKNIHGFAEANLSHYFYKSQQTYWSKQKYWTAAKFGIVIDL